MDVEYQKKEVTWCLDRVGPRICLKAIAINEKLNQLEISSEEFNLVLENDEAIEFLSILRKLMESKPAAVPIPEPLTPSIPVQEEEIPPIQHIEEPKEELSLFSKTEVEKPMAVPTLDTSEILEVLKQSESSIGEEKISFRKKFAENKALEKKVVEQTLIVHEQEEPTPGITIEEHVKPSEIFQEKLDTASFFREVEEKSPLEQLLEENEDLRDMITTDPIPPQNEEEPPTIEDISHEPEEKTPFTPDDLSSSSFMSDFGSKPFEQELDSQKVEKVEEPVEKVEDQQDTEPIEHKAFLSEEERKKEIERERAARKKRLWELTRGF